MPIQLTTPYVQPGTHGRPAKTYAQIKIVSVAIGIENREIQMACQYGNTLADGTWEPAEHLDVGHCLICNIPAEVGQNPEYDPDENPDVDEWIETKPAEPHYDQLIGSAATSATFEDKSADSRYKKATVTHPVHGALDVWNDLTYVAVANRLYQWLLDEGIYQGVIA